MKLAAMGIPEYMDVLASDAGAPGGGSASALTGAQGAGLCAMVCALTIGKKKYEEHEALCREVQEKAVALKDKFLDVMDRDTEAFNQVSAVFEMPRETDEQKEARKAAMQKALKACTLTPTEMMEYALEALRLVDSILGKSNMSAASDLGCSALNLKAALHGAWYNVQINLSGIRDEEFVHRYRAHGQQLMDGALPIAERIDRFVQSQM